MKATTIIKLLCLMFLILPLLGCENETRPSAVNLSNPPTRCVYGIRYILYREISAGGHHGYGYMALKINKVTLQAETCGE